MAAINANTGLLFEEIDQVKGLELCQEVEDRIFTTRGSRSLRPEYGSELTGVAPDIQAAERDVRRALEGHQRITDVRTRIEGSRLNVRINGRVEVQING